jgi:hypothetical protein
MNSDDGTNDADAYSIQTDTPLQVVLTPEFFEDNDDYGNTPLPKP